MEDIMQFLLIAGIIAFGIFKQYNKESKKKSEKGTSLPVPEYEYEVEKPVVSKMERKQTLPKAKVPVPHEGIRSTYVPTISPKKTDEVQTEDSEFSIHSAEEARRAIVWSEILQRKY